MSVTLQIYTSAFASVTNRIRIEVCANSAPTAVLDFLIDATAGHPARSWEFDGLPSVNLVFRVLEIDGGGATIREIGEDMYVVPGTSGSVIAFASEQITAGSTTGFTAGVNLVTFDGTGGAEDWRGREIDTIIRNNIVMKRGTDFSWDATAGTLTLLKTGDLFGNLEWFNVSFQTTSSGAVPTSLPESITVKQITANYSLDASADAGTTILINPATNYLEVQLPDITTVTAGVPYDFEFKAGVTIKCAKFLVMGTDKIDWLQGNRSDVKMLPGESFRLYKFTDTSGMSPVDFWRIKNAVGNFMHVGEQVTDDNLSSQVYNKILFDGSSLDVQQFARLFEDHVSVLGAQLVNYDDWATGNNKYKFSLSNSANPANAGKFLIPDRRNTFERNSDGTRVPGDFQAGTVQAHTHLEQAGNADGNGVLDPLQILGYTLVDGAIRPTTTSTAANVTTGEGITRPPNICVRKYLLV